MADKKAGKSDSDAVEEAREEIERALSLDKSLKFINSGNDERTENLTVAKDRAQMTATTAMSVVHVALLKSVLDSGPEGTTYYLASLILIITCLAVQIIVGILTIYITHLRNYYQRFSGDLCDDVFTNLCCCKVVSGPEEEREIRRQVSEVSALMKREEVVDLGTSLREECDHDNKDPLDRFRCCCCWMTTKMHDDYEYEILDLHEHWLKKMAEIEMSAVKAEEEIKLLNQRVQAQTLDEDELEDVSQKLESARSKRKQFILMSSQGEVLSKYADGVKKKRVLKMVTFWQNMINYLLYVVFILNAFITGLGLADNTIPSAPQAPLQQVPTEPSVSDIILTTVPAEQINALPPVTGEA